MHPLISKIQQHLTKEIAEAESAARFWREEVDWLNIQDNELRAAAASLVDHIDLTLARLRKAQEIFKKA